MPMENTDVEGLRLVMMGFVDLCAPMHDVAAGEVAYFLRQGYTDEQAHAMAAAEFTMVFGTKIYPSANRPDDEDPHPEG